ncbi:MAG: DNA/RNA non-specific endonuclease [Bacteroidales bacterium]|nr:DNA/RNA non-specific endonuclease [Bacteroidales bacterium]HQP04357.1 DNA/RNA non-specific endonuclease [Bacteroidales bacterium]
MKVFGWFIIIWCISVFRIAAGQELKLELPFTDDTDTVICHTQYCFQYSEQHEQAKWVAYEFTLKELPLTAERAKAFRTDPEVATITADNDDYYKTGYDKGHLAPSRDMAFDPIAQEESFYFSNISPQVPGFNRGIWRGLEFKVRKWVEKYDNVYVITGPVLRDNLPVIGENRVSVPEYFYKAVLVDNDTVCKAVGFVIPNCDSLGNRYSLYAVPVDTVEKLLEMDFFYVLDDNLENKAEAAVDYKFWELIKPKEE